jgi:ubiquinone/menaquinone biosynthesis C-methylase UbiE
MLERPSRRRTPRNRKGLFSTRSDREDRVLDGTTLSRPRGPRYTCRDVARLARAAPAFMSNLDADTVAGFGLEWTRYDQTGMPAEEVQRQFEAYFRVFPWAQLPQGAVGFDVGCGSGRWARLASERVGALHCVDASDEALTVARRNLAERPNCQFHHASVDALPFADGSMDFGYSLGVLHHVPDTAAGIRSCAAKLKPGAPLLLYLYYAFDNRPVWFRRLWQVSDRGRRFISALPPRPKLLATRAIAAGVYWPLARGAALAEKAGVPEPLIDTWPLSQYRASSFYTMRTDALDRFGTRLEQRFTRDQIRSMMEAAGLERITFSDEPPHWCVVGFKRAG